MTLASALSNINLAGRSCRGETWAPSLDRPSWPASWMRFWPSRALGNDWCFKWDACYIGRAIIKLWMEMFLDKNGTNLQRRKMYLGFRRLSAIQHCTTWRATSTSTGRTTSPPCRIKSARSSNSRRSNSSSGGSMSRLSSRSWIAGIISYMRRMSMPRISRKMLIYWPRRLRISITPSYSLRKVLRTAAKTGRRRWIAHWTSSTNHRTFETTRNGIAFIHSSTKTAVCNTSSLTTPKTTTLSVPTQIASIPTSPTSNWEAVLPSSCRRCTRAQPSMITLSATWSLIS